MPDATIEQITGAIKKLARKQLLVGIPMETSSRAQSEWLNIMLGGKSGTISNASLGYIHEFGSPARNIPPRPHLIPGVTKVLDEVKTKLTAAAKAALAGNTTQADAYLGQAGTLAVNSVQGVIRSGDLQALAESTLAARRLRRPDIHYRVREQIVGLEQARRDARRAGRKPDPQQMAQLEALRQQHHLGRQIHLRGAQTAQDATPLIDTGSYMRAITYVIRET